MHLYIMQTITKMGSYLFGADCQASSLTYSKLHKAFYVEFGRQFLKISPIMLLYIKV